MYRIKDILHDPQSNEVTILTDDNSFRITKHDLEMLGVKAGDDIDEEAILLLDEAVARLQCIKKAFDFLSYGDLSKKQLTEKLCRKFPKQLSCDVAALMSERGYIDDKRLAERYAETFYNFKNMGLGKIREQLYRRGIPSEIISEVLENYSNQDQNERVKSFIIKKYDINNLKDIVYRRKVYSGCLRAGFSSSDISDVLANFETDFESEF